MSARTRLLAAAACLLAAAPQAHAVVRVDTAIFPDTLSAGGTTLALNGVGVRVVFLVIRAYATALYLKQPAHTTDAVMSGPNPKAVLTNFLHAASLGQLRDESDTIHRRFCAHVFCSATDQASYAIFLAHLQPAHAGDTQLIVVTDAGVDILRDNQLVVAIPNPSFGQNLLRSLLGPAAPTARYRNGLLGVTG